MSTDEIEKLMIEVIHFLSDQFPNQAILKGGMELRLIDCPRYTNDLDYVFVPYESKKDVVSLISEALVKFPEIKFSSTINSACIRYIITRGNVHVQLEINTAPACDSEPLSTASIAKKSGYLPRIVRVMNFTNALSHKLAAWNERGLIRDLYDASFMVNNFEIYPDLVILQERLNNVSYRYKGVSGKKQMTFSEFTKKILDAVNNLTQISIEAELKDYFSPEELPGLDKKIKIGIHRIINFLQQHTINIEKNNTSY